MPSVVLRRSPGRFANNRRGATVVEYSVFTALVAGAVLIALDQVRLRTESAYTSVGNRLARDHASPDATRGGASEVQAVLPTASSPRQHLLWQLPAMGACAAIWIALVVKRRRAERTASEPLFDVEQDNDEQQDARLYAKRQQILATLVNDMQSLSSGDICVRHVMSSRLATVQRGDAVEHVREVMTQKKLRHMLVCDGERLVGVISDRDLARKSGSIAANVMTTSPLAVSPNTKLSPAVTLMMRKRISCLPVVEEGRLCGVFTTTDLIMTLQCAFQLVKKAAPNLDEFESNTKPISLRDTFTGLGEIDQGKRLRDTSSAPDGSAQNAIPAATADASTQASAAASTAV